MSDKDFSERQDIESIKNISEFYTDYGIEVMNKIFIGIFVSLGVSYREAKEICDRDPSLLQKAKFISSIVNKFSSFFKPKKIPDIQLPKIKKTISPEQWNSIEKSIDDFWEKAMSEPMEKVVLSSFFLGKALSKRKRDKSNIMKNILNFTKHIPENISDAYAKFRISQTEKKMINRSFINIASLVQDVGHATKKAIRKNVLAGIDEGKTPVQIASDLYWNVQKKGGTDSAQVLKRNWQRIAITETQALFEAGNLAAYEYEAEQSLKDNSRAQYFVFSGGSCKWCQAHQGVLVRLVPASAVKGGSDSLSEMGIEDPFTDIAIWQGKNNYGRYSYKDPSWHVCTPAHPHNVATFQEINPAIETYDTKTKLIENKPITVGDKVFKNDNHELTKKEKVERKRKVIDENTATYHGNTYKKVSEKNYENEMEKWRNDQSRPIPVPASSTSYKKIFGGK